MIIEDGTGSGNTARVQGNRIFTDSRSESSEEVEADEGNSFIIHLRAETKAVASGGLLAIINNDQTAHYKVTRIYIEPFTLTDTDLIVTQNFNATTLSGQDVTIPAFIQKNKSKTVSMDLQILGSNSVGGLTFATAEEYRAFPVSSRASTQRNMNGTNIIPKGANILFGFEREGGGTVTAGQVISFSVNIIKTVI